MDRFRKDHINIFHLSFVIHDINDFIAFCVFGMIYGILALMHRFMHVMFSGSIYEPIGRKSKVKKVSMAVVAQKFSKRDR